MQTVEIPTLWRLSFFLAVCEWISVISERDLEPNVLDLVILLVLNPDFRGQGSLCSYNSAFFLVGLRTTQKPTTVMELCTFLMQQTQQNPLREHMKSQMA